MARKVFLIYQGADAHRAEQLAALKAIKACKLVSDQGREAVVQAGDAAAVGWIRRQIRGCSCAIVLIGSPLIFAPATDGIVASSASWSGVTVVPLRAAYR